MASVETDRGVKEQLRLYDTKGLHDGQDLPKHYYSVADGFVLVYSVDSLESFRRVDVVKKEIDKSRDKKEARGQYLHRVPILELVEAPGGPALETHIYLRLLPPQVAVVVLGNKSDLREQRQVDQEVAQQWARGEKVRLWEVSVTERNSLIEPFTQLTSRLTQPQSKSSFPLPGRKSKGTASSDI